MTSLPLAWPLSPNLYKGDQKKIERLLKAAVSNSQRCVTKKSGTSRFLIAGPSLPVVAKRDSVMGSTTYETQMVILPPEESRRPFALAFSPCSRYLVSGSWWDSKIKSLSGYGMLPPVKTFTRSGGTPRMCKTSPFHRTCPFSKCGYDGATYCGI